MAWSPEPETEAKDVGHDALEPCVEHSSIAESGGGGSKAATRKRVTGKRNVTKPLDAIEDVEPQSETHPDAASSRGEGDAEGVGNAGETETPAAEPTPPMQLDEDSFAPIAPSE